MSTLTQTEFNMVTLKKCSHRDRKYLYHDVFFKNMSTKYKIALPHGKAKARATALVMRLDEVVQKFPKSYSLKEPIKYLNSVLS